MTLRLHHSSSPRPCFPFRFDNTTATRISHTHTCTHSGTTRHAYPYTPRIHSGLCAYVLPSGPRTCFLSAVTCRCSPGKMVCLLDHDSLCSCTDPAAKVVQTVATEVDLRSKLCVLAERAQGFQEWASAVHRLLPFVRCNSQALERQGCDNYALTVVAREENIADHSPEDLCFLPAPSPHTCASLDSRRPTSGCTVIAKSPTDKAAATGPTGSAQRSGGPSREPISAVLRHLLRDIAPPTATLVDLRQILARAEAPWRSDPLYSFAADECTASANTAAFLADVVKCIPATDGKREGARRLGRVQMPVSRLVEALQLCRRLTVSGGELLLVVNPIPL